MESIKKRYERDLVLGVYSPGSNLAEFLVRLKNVPGALASVSKTLSDLNINILSGHHFASPREEEGLWVFFVDLTGRESSVEEIASIIRESEVVVDVKFSQELVDGVILDRFLFPLIVLEERSIILTIESFAEISRRLYKAFGSAALVLLYEMGLSAGLGKIESIEKKYRVDGLTALRIALAERIPKGWGIPNIDELSEENLQAVVTVEELFECLPTRNLERNPTSHFFRGYLTGLFSEAFDRQFQTKETECISKGDQYCRFIIKPL
jgi:predicted hydrocarbon binding protein